MRTALPMQIQTILVFLQQSWGRIYRWRMQSREYSRYAVLLAADWAVVFAWSFQWVHICVNFSAHHLNAYLYPSRQRIGRCPSKIVYFPAMATTITEYIFQSAPNGSIANIHSKVLQEIQKLWQSVALFGCWNSSAVDRWLLYWCNVVWRGKWGLYWWIFVDGCFRVILLSFFAMFQTSPKRKCLDRTNTSNSTKTKLNWGFQTNTMMFVR